MRALVVRMVCVQNVLELCVTLCAKYVQTETWFDLPRTTEEPVPLSVSFSKLEHGARLCRS